MKKYTSNVSKILRNRFSLENIHLLIGNKKRPTNNILFSNSLATGGATL
jgi:hypothetical protein